MARQKRGAGIHQLQELSHESPFLSCTWGLRTPLFSSRRAVVMEAVRVYPCTKSAKTQMHECCRLHCVPFPFQTPFVPEKAALGSGEWNIEQVNKKIQREHLGRAAATMSVPSSLAFAIQLPRVIPEKGLGRHGAATTTRARVMPR